MHTLHGKCTGIRATESQCWRGFREIAQITHLFRERNYESAGTTFYIYAGARKNYFENICAMCANRRIHCETKASAAQICVCIREFICANAH